MEDSAACHIYSRLPGLLNKREDFALATVVGTTGSAPQRTGSSAVFGRDGIVAGTIGGGIVEHTIRKQASDLISGKMSELHRFSLSNELSDNEGAICGGNMSILFDADPGQHLDVFNAVKLSLSQRNAGVMATSVFPDKTGKVKIRRSWISGENFEAVAGKLDHQVVRPVKEMLEHPVTGGFRTEEIQGSASEEKAIVYLEMIVPPPRLIIAGAGHIGKALSHLGKMLGFEVIVWDYRSEYATRENLPDADLILTGSIGATLAEIAVDKNTYVAAVTTGHKKDIDVLKTFIGSGAGYIGMIGSRKKTILMREKFLQEGWATPEQWKDIYAPIGLAINSETVEEIAVSIAAQLIQVRHKINGKK